MELVQEVAKLREFANFVERELRDSSRIETTVVMGLLEESSSSPLIKDTEQADEAGMLGGGCKAVRLERLKEDLVARNEEWQARE